MGGQEVHHHQTKIKQDQKSTWKVQPSNHHKNVALKAPIAQQNPKETSFWTKCQHIVRELKQKWLHPNSNKSQKSEVLQLFWAQKLGTFRMSVRS